jgi:ABC-type dipeptide/oligopeptide/nickel transport system permease component
VKGYALRRALGLLPVLLTAVVLTFVANQFVPGDPITTLLSDRSGDAKLEARLRAEYGLDRPLWRQFGTYVAGILRGDFGLSFRYASTPVIEVIAPGLLVSPLLAGGALLIAVPLGVALGTFVALRRNSLWDTAVVLLLVAGTSIPNFAMAAFLVYLLSIRLGWLPVAGWGTLSQMVLPVLLLAIPPTAYLARLSRTYMLEVLQQDYIRTARAKGLRERGVVWVHALRNSLIPLITVAGVQVGYLLGGVVVTEEVFTLPGVGRLILWAVFQRDYPVVQGTILFVSFLFMLSNLVVDLIYAYVDPRIRYG